MNTQMKRNHFRNKKVMVLLFFLLGVVFVYGLVQMVMSYGRS